MIYLLLEHDHNPSELTTEETSEGNSLVRFKLECLFIIAIIGLIGGLVPLRLRVNERLLSLGNTLSGGVFLAAGFTHMLAESVEGFERLEATKNSNFPFPYALCLFGMLIIFFVEKVLISQDATEDLPLHHHHHHSHRHLDDNEHSKEMDAKKSRGIDKEPSTDNASKQYTNIYVLAFLLSIHSIIEGVALGIEDRVSDTRNILIAIVGHKMFDAFAFGVNVAKKNVTTSELIKLITLFCMMTPIGIILGISVLHDPTNSLLAETVKAISSGTFIYIAIVEIILEEFENQRDKYWKFALVVAGSLVMCALAALHDHDH
jgi:zinc transporter 1/2/3